MLTVFWDFDWSMANENSDMYVVKELSPDLYAQVKAIREDASGQYREWTPLMHELMRRLNHEHGISKDALQQCLYSLPMVKDGPRNHYFYSNAMMKQFDEVVQVIRELNEAGVRQIIVSDANSVFIESVLAHHSLAGHIERIWTNPAHFDEKGCLNIAPLHANDHGCNKCPRNLCKGMILDAEYFPAPSTSHRFAYVGDGNNDFCPSLRLGANDQVFARHDYALHKRVNASPGEIKAKLKTWSDGNQLRSHLLDFLNSP